MLRKILISALYVFMMPTFAALPQSQGQDFSFVSKILPRYDQGPRTVSYRVIFPRGYSEEKKYPVLYFLHGRNGDQYNLDGMGIPAMMDRLIEGNGQAFLIVLPSGGNHYWMNAALSEERWGDVTALELVEDVEARFPVIPEARARIVAGISMGGHGAVQLSLNYPGVFGATASHSPRFRSEEEAQLDGFDDEFGRGVAYQARDPYSLIQKGLRFSGPLWMDIGGSDVFFANTQRFAELLRTKGISFAGQIGEDRIGGHEGGYWIYHFPTYLRWYSQMFSR